MSNGNRHRRKSQKISRKRRIPVPKKAPKVQPLKTSYKRVNINIKDIDDLREE